MKSLLGFGKTTPSGANQSRSPLMSLQHEINKAINDFYHIFEPASSHAKDMENWTISPSVDLVEDKDTFKVEVEVPGMGEEDLKVSVDGGILTIQGEKTVSQKDEGKNYLSREIGYGCYERHIALPDYVDADKATASFKKGMLWVCFPKKEGSENQHRDIKVEKATN